MKKVHHAPDYLKDKTADIIMHGSGPAVPCKEWHKNMNLTPDGKSDAKHCFNPMKGKDRPTMYVKTNECDH